MKDLWVEDRLWIHFIIPYSFQFSTIIIYYNNNNNSMNVLKKYVNEKV